MGESIAVAISSKFQAFHLVTLASWLSRGVQAILQVMMLAIISGLLGVDEYAVFILISSLLAWFMLSDLGFGYALQNKISDLKSSGEDYESYIANVLWVGIFIFGIFSVLSTLLSFTLAPFYLERFSNQNNQLAFLVSAVMMVGVGVFGIIYKIWYALEKGYWSSILPALATLVSFVALSYIQSDSDNKLILIVLAYFIPLFFFPFVFYVLLLVKLKKKIGYRLLLTNSFYKTSMKFLFFALMALLVLNVDYVIASQLLSAEELVIYFTVMKVFLLGLFVYAAFLMAIWPKVSEHIAKYESDQIIGLIKRYLPIGIGFAGLFSVCVFFAGDYLYVMLVKNMDVKVGLYTILLFAIYMLCRVWTDTFAMVLQAGNMMTPLIKIVPVQAVLSIGLQVLFAYYYGLNGLVLGLILSFVTTVVWYLPYKSYFFIKENSGHA